MDKLKYVEYIMHANFGNVCVKTECYSEAFSKYKQTEIPKTLYGIDNQGSVSVIFSEG